VSTSVDPQSASLITDPAGFVELIGGVDLLLPNAAELAVLTGSEDPASASALLGAAAAVAVTTGAAGATWVDRDGIVSVPAEPADCVDSTGAGDAFDAGLLAAWLTGAAPRAALLNGVRAGARATSRLGAWPQPSIT
jgi:sugar/nucleoside kinase (ribokinase family)